MPLHPAGHPLAAESFRGRTCDELAEDLPLIFLEQMVLIGRLQQRNVHPAGSTGRHALTLTQTFGAIAQLGHTVETLQPRTAPRWS